MRLKNIEFYWNSAKDKFMAENLITGNVISF